MIRNDGWVQDIHEYGNNGKADGQLPCQQAIGVVRKQVAGRSQLSGTFAWENAVESGLEEDPGAITHHRRGAQGRRIEVHEPTETLRVQCHQRGSKGAVKVLESDP